VAAVSLICLVSVIDIWFALANFTGRNIRSLPHRPEDAVLIPDRWDGQNMSYNLQTGHIQKTQSPLWVPV
jgi:hypothetical protein